MKEQLEEIKKEISRIAEEMSKFKNDNYSVLHKTGDLHLVEKIQRSLYVCVSSVTSFVEYLDANEDYDVEVTENESD
jgi:hypothetical protein